MVDGVERDSFHDIHLSEAFNVANRCPVLAVPAGRAASGVPIGVQIVAGGYDDATAFAVGWPWSRPGPGRWWPPRPGRELTLAAPWAAPGSLVWQREWPEPFALTTREC